MLKRFELEPSQLRAGCDPKVFPFKDTPEVEPLSGVCNGKSRIQGINSSFPTIRSVKRFQGPRRSRA